jgi:hypothetical protein
MTNQEILQSAPEFRYSLLDRMKQDCLYFLGNGNRQSKYLWAGNVTEQIEFMKALWDSFPADGKPEWLSQEDIAHFQEQMEAPRSIDEICTRAAVQAAELNALSSGKLRESAAQEHGVQ